jgi:hypothetical protein
MGQASQPVVAPRATSRAQAIAPHDGIWHEDRPAEYDLCSYVGGVGQAWRAWRSTVKNETASAVMRDCADRPDGRRGAARPTRIAQIGEPSFNVRSVYVG